MIKNVFCNLVLIAMVVASAQMVAEPLNAAPQAQGNRGSATKQRDKSDAKRGQDEATIRGSLLVESRVVSDVDWDVFQGTLGQLVPLQQPKLPEDWNKRDQENRQKWITAYYESEEGKKLQASNKAKLEGRHLQNFTIRREGKFVIYDIPDGRYEMRIVGQKVIGEKTYVLQHYGQFDVGEADELDFSDTKLDVLRLLKIGEQAPSIEGTSVEGRRIALANYRGKHTLMAFGLTSNPAFAVTTKSLKQVLESEELKGKMNLLTVTVDENLKDVTEFNQKNEVTWDSLNLGKWDQETLDSYGLKSVPSLWLLDAEGKIVLTGQQFIFELNRTKFSVAKLVEDTIAGRLTIGGEKETGPTPTEAADPNEKKKDGQSDNKAPGKR